MTSKTFDPDKELRWYSIKNEAPRDQAKERRRRWERVLLSVRKGKRAKQSFQTFNINAQRL